MMKTIVAESAIREWRMRLVDITFLKRRMTVKDAMYVNKCLCRYTVLIKYIKSTQSVVVQVSFGPDQDTLCNADSSTC